MKVLIPLVFLFAASASAKLEIRETDDHIVISNDDHHVLTYHKAEMPPPEGVPEVYKRSGFIHPLTAPNGGVVTSIHAKDHYHHMGLWHAWVNTKHKDRKLDFWNLKTGKATIRYAKTSEIRKRDTSVGFTVVQEHLVLPNEVILKEDFQIDVSMDAEGNYLVDYVTVQENMTDAPLEFPAYRYGGTIAYRGPLHWNKDNSAYLTSAGKGREDGHATRADWCAMSGPTEKGEVTLTVMGHHANHDAPQRQRIWPSNINNGAIFFNFVPIQERAWALKPGEPSTMKYRLVVSNGKPEAKKIKGWFNRFK